MLKAHIIVTYPSVNAAHRSCMYRHTMHRHRVCRLCLTCTPVHIACMSVVHQSQLITLVYSTCILYLRMHNVPISRYSKYVVYRGYVFTTYKEYTRYACIIHTYIYIYIYIYIYVHIVYGMKGLFQIK